MRLKIRFSTGFKICWGTTLARYILGRHFKCDARAAVDGRGFKMDSTFTLILLLTSRTTIWLRQMVSLLIKPIPIHKPIPIYKPIPVYKPISVYNINLHQNILLLKSSQKQLGDTVRGIYCIYTFWLADRLRSADRPR
jgi:hypothetical protein